MKKWQLLFLWVYGCLAISSAQAFPGGFFGPNFHVVEPGKFYRSAQLRPVELKRRIEKYGIKTILNLRGAAPSETWYQQEAKLAAHKGVRLIDIAMEAERIPHRQELLQLLDIFEKAERPILVHCLQGADRTGLVSALYALEVMGKSKKEALSLLSSKYFHFELVYPAPRYFINAIYQGQAWARREYAPCQANYSYYDHARYCGDELFVDEELVAF